MSVFAFSTRRERLVEYSDGQPIHGRFQQSFSAVDDLLGNTVFDALPVKQIRAINKDGTDAIF